VDPHDGGSILHWDLRQQGWHLTHAVARRPEAYHDGLDAGPSNGVHSIHDSVKAKDAAVLDHVGSYDRTMRLGAQDTVVREDADRQRYLRERGHTTRPIASTDPLAGELLLALEGNGVRYGKEFRLDGGVTVEYRLDSDATLFSEWNLSLPDGAAGEPPEFRFDEGCCSISTERFSLRCGHNADDAWVDRLYSVSNTEGGVELAPQGWALVFSARCQGDGTRLLTLDWTVTE
jgi:hypothetical protein